MEEQSFEIQFLINKVDIERPDKTISNFVYSDLWFMMDENKLQNVDVWLGKQLVNQYDDIWGLPGLPVVKSKVQTDLPVITFEKHREFKTNKGEGS